jgi:DNA topoisomerase-3
MPKAFSLITLLRGLNVPELTAPELTGEWEYKLKQMEQGRLQRPDFMHEIAAMTRQIVERAKSFESDTVPGDFATLETPCPKCGGVVKENYKKFQCQKCDFALWRIVSGRQFEPAEIEELITRREIGPLQGFRSRLGKPFAALIRLSPEFKIEFDFGQSNAGADSEAPDFTGKEALGSCPKCGGKVYENGMAYVCENAVGKDRKCDFRSGRVILQRSIEPEQMKKLLAGGKTDLLHRFISKKGRPFSAYLVRGEKGNISFEFAPRAAKAAKPATASKARGKKAAEPEKAPARPRKRAAS